MPAARLINQKLGLRAKHREHFGDGRGFGGPGDGAGRAPPPCRAVQRRARPAPAPTTLTRQSTRAAISPPATMPSALPIGIPSENSAMTRARRSGGIEVGERGIGRGHAGRLADPDRHPGEEHLHEILGEAANRGRPGSTAQGQSSGRRCGRCDRPIVRSGWRGRYRTGQTQCRRPSRAANGSGRGRA